MAGFVSDPSASKPALLSPLSANVALAFAAFRILRCLALRRPFFGPAMLINDEVPGARRQDLQRFEKLDHSVLVVLGQGLISLATAQRLACVRQDGLAHRRELSMMEEGRLVGGAPELLGEKFPVAGK